MRAGMCKTDFVRHVSYKVVWHLSHKVVVLTPVSNNFVRHVSNEVMLTPVSDDFVRHVSNDFVRHVSYRILATFVWHVSYQVVRHVSYEVVRHIWHVSNDFVRHVSYNFVRHVSNMTLCQTFPFCPLVHMDHEYASGSNAFELQDPCCRYVVLTNSDRSTSNSLSSRWMYFFVLILDDSPQLSKFNQPDAFCMVIEIK